MTVAAVVILVAAVVTVLWLVGDDAARSFQRSVELRGDYRESQRQREAAGLVGGQAEEETR